MPNMTSYTYMHNHKVLNNKPNETKINNCNCRNKDKQNVTLAHVKQRLKIVSGIIKSRSITSNIKIIRNYQKNFGKSKSAMEHQKLQGKLSEHVVLTILAFMYN